MSEGLYLYCAVNERTGKNLGCIGFQDQQVYALPYRNISVVVQPCSIRELRNTRQAELAISHQYVIDLIMKKLNEAVPFSVGTVVRNKKNLNRLLALVYKKIRSELEEKKGKREYGIQIFYAPPYLQESADLLAGVKSFVLQQGQKRELSMRHEAQYKTSILNELRGLVNEIKINPAFRSLEDWKDRRILLNLSCLVHKDNVKKLEEKLAQINDEKELTVRFSGPWAPYSFTKIIGE